MAPALAFLALLVRLAVTNPSPTFQNILACSIAGAVTLFHIFMERIGPASRDGRIHPFWIGLSVLTVVTMVVQAIFWPRPWNNDKPSLYFDHEIKIGMSRDIPPWYPFDSELATFIADHYHTTWTPVRILMGEADDQLAQGAVDMVISSYTINASRAKVVDFAGPYFLDTTGVWGNLEKFDAKGKWVSPDPENKKNPTACAAGGTTGNTSLNNFIVGQSGVAGGATESTKAYATTASCLNDLFDPTSEVAYAATDWSILKAYKPGSNIMDANRTHPKIDPRTGRVNVTGQPQGAAQNKIDWQDPGLASWDSLDAPQYYGVAIKNGHPVTCADLTEVINDFVTQTKRPEQGFAHAYRTLQPALGPVLNNWHQPNLNALDWGSAKSPVCT